MVLFACFAMEYKFLMLKKRQWCLTTCELIAPTFLFLFLIYMATIGGTKTLYVQVERETAFNLLPDQFCAILNKEPNSTRTAFFTLDDSAIVAKIIERVSETFQNVLLPYCKSVLKKNFPSHSLSKSISHFKNYI